MRTLSGDLDEYRGTLSNLHGFLHRYLDTGFQDRWSGYWVPPYKYLDYYAVRVGDRYLGPETVRETDYGEDVLRFHHRLDGRTVTETVRAPADVPGITIELDGLDGEPVALELAADIRHKSEDVSGREYDLETSGNRLVIASGDRRLQLLADTTFHQEGEPRYRDHHPSGRHQRCFIPGDLVFEPGETLALELSTDRPRFGRVERVDQGFDGPLDEVLTDCVASMRNLVYDRNGTGMLAGHPWFQSYWSRDMLWTLLGLVDAGHLRTAEDILSTFIAAEGFPNEVPLGAPEGYAVGADVPPLFVVAADRLGRHDRLPAGGRAKMDDAMEELEMDGDRVVHDPAGTWMDSLERPHAIEIQSLWLEAARITGDPRAGRLADGLQQMLEQRHDADGIDAMTANMAVPLLFGHGDRETRDAVLDELEAALVGEHGARTMQGPDATGPDGYHTGSTWGLTTAWMAMAALEHGRTGTGIGLLRRFGRSTEQDQPGALPEVIDSETGAVIGCPEQAWSAGLVVAAIDSHLLGIEITGDGVVVDPPEDVTFTRRGKRIGDTSVDLRVRDGEVAVLRGPEDEIEVG